LPTVSVTLTEKVCAPSARAAYVFGEVQDAKSPASRLHSKVDPGSEETKEKLGDTLFEGSGGFAVIVTVAA